MQITFIEHSSFLVELPSVTLLFDWYQGKLPKIPAGKPLLVFASHCHSDHFSPDIFQLDDGKREVRCLLGFDIPLDAEHADRWKIDKTVYGHCISVQGEEKLQPLPGVHVESFFSTDEGVAFLVEADGRTIYHAGDLNWWHWKKDTKEVNEERAERFKRFVQPLAGRKIDAAMVPVDPRQEEAGYWTAEYMLQHTAIRALLPMHQWGKFDFTDGLIDRLNKRMPGAAEKIVRIMADGQKVEV